MEISVTVVVIVCLAGSCGILYIWLLLQQAKAECVSLKQQGGEKHTEFDDEKSQNEREDLIRINKREQIKESHQQSNKKTDLEQQRKEKKYTAPEEQGNNREEDKLSKTQKRRRQRQKRIEEKRAFEEQKLKREEELKPSAKLLRQRFEDKEKKRDQDEVVNRVGVVAERSLEYIHAHGGKGNHGQEMQAKMLDQATRKPAEAINHADDEGNSNDDTSRDGTKSGIGDLHGKHGRSEERLTLREREYERTTMIPMAQRRSRGQKMQINRWNDVDSLRRTDGGEGKSADDARIDVTKPEIGHIRGKHKQGEEGLVLRENEYEKKTIAAGHQRWSMEQKRENLMQTREKNWYGEDDRKPEESDTELKETTSPLDQCKEDQLKMNTCLVNATVRKAHTESKKSLDIGRENNDLRIQMMEPNENCGRPKVYFAEMKNTSMDKYSLEVGGRRRDVQRFERESRAFEEESGEKVNLQRDTDVVEERRVANRYLEDNHGQASGRTLTRVHANNQSPIGASYHVNHRQIDPCLKPVRPYHQEPNRHNNPKQNRHNNPKPDLTEDQFNKLAVQAGGAALLVAGLKLHPTIMSMAAIGTLSYQAYKAYKAFEDEKRRVERNRWGYQC